MEIEEPKLIKLNEWKLKENNNSIHLKSDGNFDEMNNQEIRNLLEKLVNRQNYLFDVIEKINKYQISSFKSFKKLNNNQQELVKEIQKQGERDIELAELVSQNTNKCNQLRDSLGQITELLGKFFKNQ